MIFCTRDEQIINGEAGQLLHLYPIRVVCFRMRLAHRSSQIEMLAGTRDDFFVHAVTSTDSPAHAARETQFTNRDEST